MTRTGDTAFDEADLNSFVDGRIDPARGTALAESLASDPEARARLEGWKRQNESLRTMFASVLYEPVPARLSVNAMPPRSATAQEVKPREVGANSDIGRGVLVTTSVGMALVGFAIGALASTGLDSFGLFRHAAPASGDAAIERVAMARSPSDVAVEAHRTYAGDVLRPVELTAAEGPKLAGWIQRRLGPEARIPDLTRQGWSLMGGRVLPGSRGPAAFLLFGHGADRLGLTLSRSAGFRAETTAAHDGVDPVSSTAWADDAYQYVLTTDHGTTWLARNATPIVETIRAQARDAAPEP